MLDTRYKFIDLDLLLHTNNEKLLFYKSDVETSDFYLRIKRNKEEILNLKNYSITLAIENPNKVIKYKTLQYDEKLGCIYCNLEKQFTDIEGSYICQVRLEDPDTLEAKNTRSQFEYIVQTDIFSEKGNTEESKNITVTYDAGRNALIFDCDVAYNEETKTVEVI